MSILLHLTDEQQTVMDAITRSDATAGRLGEVTGMTIRKLRRILNELREANRIFIAAYTEPKTGYPAAIFRAGRGIDVGRFVEGKIAPRSAYREQDAPAFMSLLAIERAMARPYAAAH